MTNANKQEQDFSLIEQLNEIQVNLNAPKNLHNKFGNYNYRSCESILNAVKPLLNGLILTLTDEMVELGGRIYVKAIVTITDGKESIVTNAFARESETKKGMDESQITGAASSYARKYALNGLFLIDDTKDADDLKPEDSTEKPAKEEPAKEKIKMKLSTKQYEKALERIGVGELGIYEQVKEMFILTPEQDKELLRYQA